MYILLVAVEMQLKATAILIPRDTTEEAQQHSKIKTKVGIAYKGEKSKTT
jgi:hypothetical protein